MHWLTIHCKMPKQTQVLSRKYVILNKYILIKTFIYSSINDFGVKIPIGPPPDWLSLYITHIYFIIFSFFFSGYVLVNYNSS